MVEPGEIYVVDVFREVVAAVSKVLTPQLQKVHKQITGVHSLEGHYKEISARLVRMTASPIETFNKYPLICLFQDFTEISGEDGGDFYSSLHMMILYYTKQESYTKERYDTVFKPLLYPIKREFVKQLYKHKNVVFEYEGKRTIHKTDRPNWGDKDKYGNDGHIFSDTLDGIEIYIPKLTFQDTNQNC